MLVEVLRELSHLLIKHRTNLLEFFLRPLSHAAYNSLTWRKIGDWDLRVGIKDLLHMVHDDFLSPVISKKLCVGEILVKIDLFYDLKVGEVASLDFWVGF